MKTLEKQQAVSLRHQGLSYREIQAVLPVSRGSLSRWLRAVRLTQPQRVHLDERSWANRERFIESNERKRVERFEKKRAICEQAEGEVGSLTTRELHLLGTALYWAEGAKGTLTSVVEFVNADPAMVALMMRWFRVCCSVPEEKLRARVQLHNVLQRQEVEQFWSELTGIPLARFTQPILKLSSTSQKKRGNVLPYGIVHIRIADVQLLTKIHGWIKGLSLAPSSSPA